ncbi:hypothetical protein GXM_09167 [Nostoc sphaeroides CCNUC1]|uniref:Uncharacterized protein n=1 Tax=Nostoc sphaeroides CCNUC1 TaxID=2653204 RepID=A0A5P8WFQ2_9NOSO|nr:hypothetical protein GXM_09167 [Nostoc sphaeroides CCNUC1]
MYLWDWALVFPPYPLPRQVKTIQNSKLSISLLIPHASMRGLEY